MSTALANRSEHHDLPSTDIALAIAGTMEQLKAVRTFIDNEFKVGTDYGKIPGCGDKPTLFLPGAQKATMYFNCFPAYKVRETNLGGGHVSFRVRCVLISRASKDQVGEGVGSCSTMESKYRYRKAEKVCPKCGKNAIIKGKAEYGGGWVCFEKKGGCKAKFADNAAAITSQPEGLVENPDPYDQHNTVLKIAKKRSHVDAAITLGCLSEMFTQDIEDTFLIDDVRDVGRVVDGEIVAEHVPDPEPQGPAVPHTDNGSGHGKTGTFASVEQTIAFNKWLSEYCKKLNSRWHEIWEKRMEDGKPIPDDLKDYLHVNQAKNHLMKWCVDMELLDPNIIPEGVKVEQKDKLIAIPYHRCNDDRQLIRAEMTDYAAKQKTIKETAIFRKWPEMAPQGWADEYAEAVAKSAEEESQEDDYVAPEAPKKRPTKKEMADLTKARAEAEATANAAEPSDGALAEGQE